MVGRILVVAAAALATGTLAGAAPASPVTGPPEAPGPVVYSVEAVEQSFDSAGRPLGPPTPARAAEHRPTAADRAVEAGWGRAGRTLQGHGSSGCRSLQVTRIGRSLLGYQLFRYWQTKYWCWNASHTVYNVQIGASGSTSDPTWFYRGTITAQGWPYTWCCSNGSSGHYSLRQGKFEQVVLGRTLSSKVPWVKIWVRGNGSYSYETGGT